MPSKRAATLAAAGLLLIGLAAPITAQTPEPTPSPTPTPPPPDRDFRPSEEVGADDEVDFPADL
jgi:hypothetical protein